MSTTCRIKLPIPRLPRDLNAARIRSRDLQRDQRTHRSLPLTATLNWCQRAELALIWLALAQELFKILTNEIYLLSGFVGRDNNHRVV